MSDNAIIDLGEIYQSLLLRHVLGVFLVGHQICQELTSNRAVEGVLRLGCQQQSVDAVKDLLHRHIDHIVAVENRVADPSQTVDVAVIDLGEESDHGWLLRVFLRELNVEDEDSVLVGGSFGAHEQHLPECEVLSQWVNAEPRVRVLVVERYFLHNPFLPNGLVGIAEVDVIVDGFFYCDNRFLEHDGSLDFVARLAKRQTLALNEELVQITEVDLILVQFLANAGAQDRFDLEQLDAVIECLREEAFASRGQSHALQVLALFSHHE